MNNTARFCFNRNDIRVTLWRFFTLAVSPDGKTAAATTGKTVFVLDAATLQLKTSFSVQSQQFLLNYPSAVIGPDNQTLYLSNIGSFVYAYNLSSGALVGWVSNIQTLTTFTNSVYLQAVSDNGLIAGIVDQGIGLVDIFALNTNAPGTAFGPSQLSSAYGPASGGTSTTWTPSSRGLSTPPKLSDAYFGSNPASNLTASSTGTYTISATSPAGAPGPVDVTTTAADGAVQTLPEAFSYGPSVIEAPTQYGTADGGGRRLFTVMDLVQSQLPGANSLLPPV
jgi:hypothetical protein